MAYDYMSNMPKFGTPQVPGAPMAPGVPPQAGQPPNPYGLDPRVLEAMLGTYGDQLEMSAQEKQLEQAQALRGMATPEGRQAGRVYVAANPLEHLGTGIQKYRAGKKAQGIEDELARTRKRIGTNVATYGKNIPR